MLGVAEEIQEISLSGFKVVSSDFFHGSFRPTLPLLTIWHDSISFSKAAIASLNNCERIRIEVDAPTKRILIVPVSSSDRDAIRWTRLGKTTESRKLDCAGFTKQLYATWEWKSNYVYRGVGRLVTVEKKLMLLFDFNNYEDWELKPRKKDDKNA